MDPPPQIPIRQSRMGLRNLYFFKTLWCHLPSRQLRRGTDPSHNHHLFFFSQPILRKMAPIKKGSKKKEGGILPPKRWLLLLLSRFSRVRLCATPETAAHQAPPSLGFSRQEQWSGLPFPSPMHESEKWKWSRSVVSDSSQPHGLQPTGSSVHGIFQARGLEWGAIAT